MNRNKGKPLRSTQFNKKKIIILDDIDIINEQSQQVFRNCMDKYSHKVHFISSCTNVQKVIDSLQSRNIIIKINQIGFATLPFIFQKINLFLASISSVFDVGIQYSGL